MKFIEIFYNKRRIHSKNNYLLDNIFVIHPQVKMIERLSRKLSTEKIHRHIQLVLNQPTATEEVTSGLVMLSAVIGSAYADDTQKYLQIFI